MSAKTRQDIEAVRRKLEPLVESIRRNPKLMDGQTVMSLDGLNKDMERLNSAAKKARTQGALI